MGLLWSDVEEIWDAMYVGAHVEFANKKAQGEGEIVDDGPAEVFVVQISWKSYAISQYGLKNDDYTKLIINGKRYI